MRFRKHRVNTKAKPPKIISFHNWPAVPTIKAEIVPGRSGWVKVKSRVCGEEEWWIEETARTRSHS
jgi:hypothetical protein